MKKERLIKTVRLQENLASIRKIAGWTAEDLGELLGVSKQNISNLENDNTKLSQAQYVAIRHFLDYQITHNLENTALPLMTHLLLDRLEIVGRDYKSLKDTAQNIGVAASTMNGETLRIFTITLLKASYTRVSDLTEINSTIKDAIEADESHDWTADIIGNVLKEDKK